MPNDFLMHYGIPGMKWGVRRFQEKGSSKRTPAGKKRYASKDHSAKNQELNFGGRKFKVRISYDNYEGEKITKNQRNTKDSIKNIDFKGSFKSLRKFIHDNNERDLNEFDRSDSKIKNPFRYVKPTSVLVPKDQKNSSTFHILCNYRFDPEHGIAITYENGKPKKVVHQDYVL